MKCNKITSSAVALVLALSLVGCKTRSPKTTPLGQVNPPAGSGSGTSASPVATSDTTGTQAPGDATGLKLSDDAVKPVNTPVRPPVDLTKSAALNGVLSSWVPSADQPFHDPVYFEFDKSNIKSSESSKIEAVAAYLKNQSGKGLRVEGHCDERGTEEYNRSLGERRALSVREALMRAGVDGNLVDTISFGEDRPADPGHNETAWSKNRRGEFIVIEPPGPVASK